MHFSTLLTKLNYRAVALAACIAPAAVCLLAAGPAQAQDKRVTLTAKTLTVGEAFRQIEAQTGYTIVYDEAQLRPSRTATLANTGGTAKEILTGLLAGTGQSWSVSGNYVVLKTVPKAKPAPASTARPAPAPGPEAVQGMAIPTHTERVILPPVPVFIPVPSFGIVPNHFADVEATVAPVSGAKEGFGNRVAVTADTYAIEGERLIVELTAEMNAVQIPVNSLLMLTPILKSGDVVMSLPAAVMCGLQGEKAYSRMDVRHKGPRSVKVERDGEGKLPRTFTYATAVAYEPWMSGAQLLVREDLRRGNSQPVPVSSGLLVSEVEDRNPPPAPPFMDVAMDFVASIKVPNPEPVKNRSESGKAFLDFKAGRSEINPDLGNNASELEKIGELVRSVKNNPYARVTSIVIEGWASPDGSATANQNLSAARAAALKTHLQSTYGFASKILHTAGKGEDWETLGRMVEESDYTAKEQILAIARNGKPLDIRERGLRALDGGKVFRQLTQDIFPRLRRSEYRLDFTIVTFTVEQGKQVIKEAPANLSLNEMFLVAQSYEPGSTEYNEVFGIAARVYPGSDIANLNEAATALAKGDRDTASALLQKIGVRDAAWENNMGVCAALGGDYQAATAHFNKAQTQGNAQAAGNMAAIVKLEEAKKTK